MKRSRRSTAKPLPPESDSEDETTPKKKPNKEEDAGKQLNLSESSSDESDMDLYLKPAHKIDLNSSFFNVQKSSEPSTSFDNIEKNIFSGVTRLSDSDSAAESDNESQEQTINKTPDITIEAPKSPATNTNFNQLKEYKDKIEEARKHAEQYEAKKKKALDTTQDISNLLYMGEGKVDSNITLHSSDFESCDSEQEDWEEIKGKENEEKKLIPTNGVEIVVNMPDTVRKKNKTDFVSAMKRRLNRIRKENQVYVHKVHLLSWISHGLYVNSCINNPDVLAMALSLLPSEQCYPSNRCDLKYLESILKWYKKTVHYTPGQNDKDLSLENALKLQMNRKEAFTQKAWVLIFVAILRSLGIQCRVVFSFVVEPIRPPASQLHSLSTKSDKEKNGKQDKVQSKKESATKESKSKERVINRPRKRPTAVKDVEENGVKSKKVKIEESKKIENISKDAKPNLSKLKSQKKGKQKENDVVEPKPKTPPKTVVKEVKKKPDLSKIKNALKDERTRSRRGHLVEGTSKKEGKLSNENEKSSPKTKTETKDSKAKEDKTKPNLAKIKKTASTKSKKAKNKLEVIKIKLPERRSRSPNQKTESEPLNTSKTKSKSKTTLDNPDLQKLRRSLRKKSPTVPQTDGNYDDSSDSDGDSEILQLDGATDEKSKKGKSKKSTPDTNAQDPKNPKRPLRSRTSKVTFNVDYNSEDEFQTRSPLTVKHGVASGSQNKYRLNLKRLNLSMGPGGKIKPLEDVEEPVGKPLDVRNDIIQLIKGRISNAKEEDRHLKAKKRKPVSDHESSDSDFLVEEPKKPKRNIKVSSSGSETENKKNKTDVWAEVFLEMEEKWISVDVVNGRVHCVKELHSRATQPVAYVVAFNNDNSLKDVTSRYCQNFNTVTRKLRVDSKWWTETITPFLGPKNARDKEEDDELQRQQLEKPLPTSIAEYKNHPLYVLSRHLLKFEAIYPPDAPTLGFVRGQPVYSRSCVYTLHSRDIWLKHAKVVKLGEKPYKIVKARPKYDKLSNKVITDQLLEIFGPWQVEDYVPPTAENGIVPRNAFGNVELFKPCMLPKKTVHLQLPGLNKIAKRMNIDCASAVVGFDFHGGWSHPTFDGFVVCEEFEDTLIAAWHLEQEEAERKEQEKMEARVYGNWKKLIKGLLIRERLKARYDFGDPKKEPQKKKKSKAIKFCTKTR